MIVATFGCYLPRTGHDHEMHSSRHRAAPATRCPGVMIMGIFGRYPVETAHDHETPHPSSPPATKLHAVWWLHPLELDGQTAYSLWYQATVARRQRWIEWA